MSPHRSASYLAAFALCVALPSGAQSQSAGSPRAATPKPAPTPDSLQAIERRGLRLAQHDFVAWAASDSVQNRRPAAGLLERYVLRATTDSTWSASFGRLNASRDTFFVAYEVRQRANDLEQFDVLHLSPARPDTGYGLRAARAIETAVNAFGPQRSPYNASVLEREDGGFWVYLTPAQRTPNVYPLGGDVRYQIAHDGRRIVAMRRLHQSIIQFGAARRDSAELKAGMHSAVLDDIPEDTDVFHVLVRQPHVPEYVVSQEFLYTISPDGHIRLMGRTRDVLGHDRTP